MKKRIKKLLCVLLTLSLLLALTFSAFGASETSQRIGNALKQGGLSLTEGILCGVLSAFNALIPDRTNAEKPEAYAHENFYPGTQTFLHEPAENARWQLGCARASLVPEDWQTHTYYLGGFIGIENGFQNKLENVIDDMRVRAVALSDGSGRGVSVFAVIDSIGVSNRDIRAIRAQLQSAAQAQGIELCGVTVCSTHVHSGIDTQGLWTNLGGKIFKNWGAALVGAKPESGADEGFLSFLRQTTAETMLQAICNMTPGTMTYAKKDLGSQYFSNKNRKSATALPGDLHRFLFTPDDPSQQPTILCNLGAHPDVAGLPTSDNSGRELSGDYVYYLADELARFGYQSVFFNSAIAGIYIGRGPSSDNVTINKRYEISARYGREIARILLGMTMTENEIRQSAFFDEAEIAAERADAERNGGGYTLWCENWEPAAEQPLPPMLNLRFKEVLVPITNPLICAAGKLRLVNYDILRGKNGGFAIYTEIGYCEIGGIGVALVPGELVTDLYAGGASLTAAGSARGKDFGYPCLKSLFGEDILCFGLANDAIGYIVPDNDYKLALLDDHYQEMISLGEHTASTLMAGFVSLAEELRAAG